MNKDILLHNYSDNYHINFDAVLLSNQQTIKTFLIVQIFPLYIWIFNSDFTWVQTLI
jgi:hypothetical protein